MTKNRNKNLEKRADFDENFLNNGKFRIENNKFKIINFYANDNNSYYYIDYIMDDLQNRIEARENAPEEYRRFSKGVSRYVEKTIKNKDCDNAGLRLFRLQSFLGSESRDNHKYPQLVLQYYDIGFESGRLNDLMDLSKYKEHFFDYLKNQLKNKEKATPSYTSKEQYLEQVLYN